MKKTNFPSWYYGEGINEYLEIWKDFLSFFWRYFSVRELFLTLFSPWRKDVAHRYWRGWNPLKSLELFGENLFSRLIGSIVRSFVILAGIAVLFFTLIGGLALLFIWLSFPILLVLVLAYMILGKAVFSIFFIFLLLFALVIYLSFRESQKTPLIQMGLEELVKKEWFSRVYRRMGIKKSEVDEHIFKEKEAMNSFLKNIGLTFEDAELIINWEMARTRKEKNKRKFWLPENLARIKAVGKQWKFAYTPHLDEYTTDLSGDDYSEYGASELIGRKEEFELLKLVLNRPDENNALIVGDSGTGKKTLVHYLARLIRENSVDFSLRDVRMLLFDMGKMISDVLSKGGDVDNVLHAMFYEAAYAGNVVLFIENVENYLGKEQDMYHPDVSAVISKYLPLPTFRIIATSTQKEYHSLIERHEQFMKYLEVIEMKEPIKEEAVKILLQNLEEVEGRRIVFTYSSVKHLVSVSSKYNYGVPLPERAIDLAMEVLVYWQKNPQFPLITKETVDGFLSLKTGMPQGEIKEEEKGALLNLEEVLHRRIIGQEEAVRQVAEALRRARTGLGSDKKPIGSFLFLGPTGVGKTETAKALAEAYYGDEEKMIRLDMSEFQSPDSIDRLIGSANLDKQGRLATMVKDNPFSLLLLDEIEKAYPDILDIFLQILDEGMVTDAFGEKISFRNIIIIATSNAGAVIIKEEIKKGNEPEDIKSRVIDYAVANNIFRLEFLNRFNDIIFFRPLSDSELISVVKLIVGKFARRLKEEKNIDVSFTGDAVERIISAGYDPVFGARSLLRYVEDKIEDVIARKIISGEIAKGQVINISADDIG